MRFRTVANRAPFEVTVTLDILEAIVGADFSAETVQKFPPMWVWLIRKNHNQRFYAIDFMNVTAICSELPPRSNVSMKKSSSASI